MDSKSPAPRLTLDDDYVDGMQCAICGQISLRVVHLDTLPDFVGCNRCDSAFVVEVNGERVMYGKIDAEFADTRQFALRQWVWPAAIKRRASLEAPVEPVAEPITPSQTKPIPPEPHQPAAPIPPQTEITPQSEPPGLKPVIEPGIREIQEEPLPASVPLVGEEEVSLKPSPALRENDPPPGQRFRVVIRSEKVKFPRDVCSHCMKSPTRGVLSVTVSLLKGQVIGQRKSTTFKLPLCTECNKRIAQRSEEEKLGRLQAYLISALVSLVLLVAALALGVSPSDQGASGTLILIILTVMGYAITSLVLRSRLGPYPIPPDASYVRSTLLVPSESQSLETAFEWRNQAYAERFHLVNEDCALGEVTKVKDRSIPTDTKPFDRA